MFFQFKRCTVLTDIDCTSICPSVRPSCMTLFALLVNTKVSHNGHGNCRPMTQVVGGGPCVLSVWETSFLRS